MRCEKYCREKLVSIHDQPSNQSSNHPNNHSSRHSSNHSQLQQKQVFFFEAVKQHVSACRLLLLQSPTRSSRQRSQVLAVVAADMVHVGEVVGLVEEIFIVSLPTTQFSLLHARVATGNEAVVPERCLETAWKVVHLLHQAMVSLQRRGGGSQVKILSLLLLLLFERQLPGQFGGKGG